jgi:AcrR family transcriptional regulator
MRGVDVARELGVTRSTVYRYFPSVEALLIAVAVSEIAPYLENLASHLRDISDPAEAVVEGIAYTLESLPKEKYLGMLLTPGRASMFSAGVTSDVSLTFGRSILERSAVDWESMGFGGDKLTSVAEHMLRIGQSFIIDPGRPLGRARSCETICGTGLAPRSTRTKSLRTSHFLPTTEGSVFRITSGQLGVMQTRPATRIALHWFWNDLEELGWVRGVIPHLSQ